MAAERSCKTRMIMRMVRYSWNRNISPFDHLRKVGRILAGKFLTKFMRDRMNSLSKTDFDAFHKYLYQIALLPGSSEYALTRIFNLGIWAKDPLEYRLPELQTKLSFFYGSDDWTDSESAKRVADQMDYECKVNIVPNSDHHMYFDNPEVFADMIIEDLDEYVIH